LKFGSLDYVCSWYIKAEEYIAGTSIEVAFVSTNSITQGEQVSILWKYLLNKGVKINFAHRTFDWVNKARGKAGVFVIIICFGYKEREKKLLYDYQTPNSEPLEINAKNINPYLIDYEDMIIESRSKPLCDVPKITWGSKPVDNGKLILSEDEKKEYLKNEPKGKKFIKPLISTKEHLNNRKRWCFWLVDVSPSEIKDLPELKKRLECVKEFRLNSKKEATNNLADYPYLFGEIRQPKNDFIFIPLTTSEKRKYLPLDLLTKDHIINNSVSVIENANLYHFGILISEMHMAWMSQICGKLEGRYRYSNKIVYNNFPWPKNPTKKKVNKVKDLSKEILDVRRKYEDSLSDLYDPLLMPKDLREIHKKLDRAVDKCYNTKKHFIKKLDRLIFLFKLHEEFKKKN
jgi:hypothetical protein